MQQNEDYVLKVLQDVGLVSRKQIDAARARLDGQNSVVDLLVKDGIVNESDVSRSLAAQAHMDFDLNASVLWQIWSVGATKRTFSTRSIRKFLWIFDS